MPQKQFNLIILSAVGMTIYRKPKRINGNFPISKQLGRKSFQRKERSISDSVLYPGINYIPYYVRIYSILIFQKITQ